MSNVREMMSMNFANPKTDFVFKRLFGTDGHKDLTKSLLNNILERKSGNLITDVTFYNTDNIPVADGEKESYLDILCQDQAGHYFIIEMQIAKDQAFGKRSLYYSSLRVVDQMHNKDLYSKIKPVIFIGILSNPMFGDKSRVVSHHLICDMDTGRQSFDELEFHYVELCNFHTELNDLQTDLDKWLYFLKKAEDLQVIPDQFAQSKEFKEAFLALEQTYWSAEERRAYRKSLDLLTKDMRLQAGVFDDGLAEGERREKEKIVMNLLKKKMNSEEIAEITDLSVEQIEALKKRK